MGTMKTNGVKQAAKIPIPESALSYRSFWLAQFSLNMDPWKRDAKARLANLPFVASTDLLPLLSFLFNELPAHVARSRSPDYRRVADAFGWLCFQAWQSASHFPAFAENHAGFLQSALKAKRLPPTALLIADIILPDTPNSHCGFQRLTLADAGLIQQTESRLATGDLEPFLKAPKKYAEFSARLKNEPGFRRDWKALCQTFPVETTASEILHRTLVPERNWVRDQGAQFRTRGQQFQAAFDLVCWKYCLWGVARGRPLLLKPSVVFTPHGTQIFIPAYLSFDAKRDLNLGLITRLHRARGLQRQGEGFSASRTERATLRKKARSADEKARQLNLKGKQRFAYIADQIGWLDHGDPRSLRKLLSRM